MAEIVVIGGSGLIGSKVVAKLGAHGHEAVAASPQTGVNTLTGEGLAEVIAGARTVVDVSNSPSFAAEDVLEFFTTSTRNLLAAEAEAGVARHVALTIVGTDRPQEIPYFAAKAAQEKLIRESGIDRTLVHATQFFEFVERIADEGAHGNVVRVPAALIQPMAADDVAAAVCEISQRAPANGVIEIGGPERFTMEEFIRRGLEAKGDRRTVVSDGHARYFGAELAEDTLVPANAIHLGGVRLGEWLAGSAAVPRA